LQIKKPTSFGAPSRVFNDLQPLHWKPNLTSFGAPFNDINKGQ
jgi:hypothetical protein